MAISRIAVVVCLAAFLYGSGRAVGLAPPAHASRGSAAFLSGPGSSSSLPDAPDPGDLRSAIQNGLGPRTGLRLYNNPFSRFAIAFTSGAGGLGVDVATPLMAKINLRVGASFLNYNPVLVERGIPIAGSIRFRSVNAGIEVYPYHNTFHITPGFTFYNGNKVDAITTIVPGSTFTLSGTPYVSDPADPVYGGFDVSLGRKIAPSLTFGFGNMLRRDSHWSIPVDFGFQYVGQPRFVMNLSGSVCQMGVCTPIIGDAGAQSDLAQQQSNVNHDISPLRFYPIFKVGISYRFGHNTNMSMWR